MSQTTSLPRHNPDTHIERLGSDWVYCPHCGWPVRRDEVDATSCDPRKKREYAKYVATQARIDKIRLRMEERRAKFNAAQQADELAIHNLNTLGTIKRAASLR